MIYILFRFIYQAFFYKIIVGIIYFLINYLVTPKFYWFVVVSPELIFIHMDDSSPAFLNCSSNHFFLLSLGLSMIALIVSLLVNLLKSSSSSPLVYELKIDEVKLPSSTHNLCFAIMMINIKQKAALISKCSFCYFVSLYHTIQSCDSGGCNFLQLQPSIIYT